MIFAGIVKSSLVDYPGYVSCVLFVPGCNFNCFYCHNRELIEGPHDVLNCEKIIEFLRKRRGLLDGVVLSGGEPTLQDGLLPAMKTFKDFGYKVKLDTNGSNPEIIEKILVSGLCDYFSVDYKAPASRYREICGDGADAEKVLKTIGLLLNSGVSFEVRTTVIPQLTDSDLLIMAKELPKLPKYRLNRYRKPEKFMEEDILRISEKPYSTQQITDFSDEIRKIQPNVSF